MSSLNVVGGSYREICHFPHWRQLFGSAGRAACATVRLCSSVTLHTAIGTEDVEDLQALAGSFGVALRAEQQPHTVTFEYFHGLSTPATRPVVPFSSGIELRVSGAAILRFGMVEADALIQGERVVYDPQAPSNPRPFNENGSTAERLSIVLNRAEGQALTGQEDPAAIADALLGRANCEVVIVKQGADGALVATLQGQRVRIPAYETDAVFPIGSGDVFSAVFAAAWAANEVDPIAAARFASAGAAYYCATKALPVPTDERTVREAIPNMRALQASKRRGAPRCYLAGPFFTMAQRWLIEEARVALASQGLAVFSPFHEVGIGKAEDVVPRDLDAIERSDILFAIVDGLDSGTLFEVGYARSRNIPVVAFAQVADGQDLKLLDGSRCRVERDFTTAVYRTNWIAFGR